MLSKIYALLQMLCVGFFGILNTVIEMVAAVAGGELGVKVTHKDGKTVVTVGGEVIDLEGRNVVTAILAISKLVATKVTNKAKFLSHCRKFITKTKLRHPQEFNDAIGLYKATHPDYKEDQHFGLFGLVTQVTAVENYAYILALKMQRKNRASHVRYIDRIQANKERILNALVAVGVLTVEVAEEGEEANTDNVLISHGVKYTYCEEQAVAVFGEDKGRAMMSILKRGIMWRTVKEYNVTVSEIKHYVDVINSKCPAGTSTIEQYGATVHSFLGYFDRNVETVKSEDAGHKRIKVNKAEYVHEAPEEVCGTYGKVTIGKKSLVLDLAIAKTIHEYSGIKKVKALIYRVQEMMIDAGLINVTKEDIDEVLDGTSGMEEYDKDFNLSPFVNFVNSKIKEFGVQRNMVGFTPITRMIKAKYPNVKFVTINARDARKEYGSKFMKKLITEGFEAVTEWEIVDVSDNGEVAFSGKPKQVEHFTYLGMSSGDMKKGKYLFVSVPDEITEPRKWVMSMWATLMGFHDMAKDILEDAEEATALDYFLKRLSETKSGLISKDGKAQIGKLISRLTLMFSTVIDTNFYTELTSKFEDGTYKAYVTPEKVSMEVVEAGETTRKGFVKILDFFKFKVLGKGEGKENPACEGGGYASFNVIVDLNIMHNLISEAEGDAVKSLYKTLSNNYKIGLSGNMKTFMGTKLAASKEQKHFRQIFEKMATTFQLRFEGGAKCSVSLADFKTIHEDVKCIKYDGLTYNGETFDDSLDEINKNCFDEDGNGIPCQNIDLLLNGSGVKYLSPDWYKRFNICTYSKPSHKRINVGNSVIAALEQEATDGSEESLNLALIKYIEEEILEPLNAATLSKEMCIDFLKAFTTADIVVGAEEFGTESSIRKEAVHLLKRVPSYFYTAEFRSWFKDFITKILDNAQRCTINVPGYHNLVIADYAHAFNVWLKPNMEAAVKEHNKNNPKHPITIKFYHIKELAEQVGKLFKSIDAHGFAHYNNMSGKADAPLFAIAWRYPCYCKSEIKIYILISSKMHWFLRHVFVVDGKEAVIVGQQDGDFDGDSFCFVLSNTKIGRLFLKFVSKARSIILDTPEWTREWMHTEKVAPLFEKVKANAENFIDRLIQYDEPDSTGMISISAFNSIEIVNTLKELKRVAKILGIKKIKFNIPDSKTTESSFNIDEIDNQQGFDDAKDKPNPLNKNTVSDNDDRAAKQYTRKRRGIVIDIEKEIAGVDKDRLRKVIKRVKGDPTKRYFLGWSVKTYKGETVICAEMPVHSYKVNVGTKEKPKYEWHTTQWSPFIPGPSEDETEVMVDFINRKIKAFESSVKGVDAAVNLKDFKFGGRTTTIKSGKKALTEVEDSMALNMTDIDKLIEAYRMLGDTLGVESGREIDKLKKLIGAIMTLTVPMTPTHRIFSDIQKGKSPNEERARSSYVACSACAAVHEYIAAVRGDIEKNISGAAPSFSAYALSRIDQEDVQEVFEINDTVREIRDRYLIAMINASKSEDRENIELKKSQIIETFRDELYDLCDTWERLDGDKGISPETLAMVVYFIGCEKNVSDNGLTRSTSFSWLMQEELISLFENDPNNHAVVRVNKNVTKDQIIIEDGWVMCKKDDGEHKLIERISNDTTFTTTDFKFTEGNHGNYVTVARGVHEDVKGFKRILALPHGRIGLVFNIRMTGAGKIDLTRDELFALAKPYAGKKISYHEDVKKAVTIEFGFDEETKSITAFAVKGKEKKAIGFCEIYTRQPKDEKNNPIGECMFEQDPDSASYDRTLVGNQMLLSLIGDRYLVSLDKILSEEYQINRGISTTLLQNCIIVAVAKK